MWLSSIDILQKMIIRIWDRFFLTTNYNVIVFSRFDVLISLEQKLALKEMYLFNSISNDHDLRYGEKYTRKWLNEFTRNFFRPDIL